MVIRILPKPRNSPPKDTKVNAEGLKVTLIPFMKECNEDDFNCSLMGGVEACMEEVADSASASYHLEDNIACHVFPSSTEYDNNS